MAALCSSLQTEIKRIQPEAHLNTDGLLGVKAVSPQLSHHATGGPSGPATLPNIKMLSTCVDAYLHILGLLKSSMAPALQKIPTPV